MYSLFYHFHIPKTYANVILIAIYFIFLFALCTFFFTTFILLKIMP